MHIAQTSKVRVKQGKTVLVISPSCPLQVSWEHSATPALQGFPIPGVLPHTSPFPATCLLLEGPRVKLGDALSICLCKESRATQKGTTAHKSRRIRQQVFFFSFVEQWLYLFVSGGMFHNDLCTLHFPVYLAIQAIWEIWGVWMPTCKIQMVMEDTELHNYHKA